VLLRNILSPRVVPNLRQLLMRVRADVCVAPLAARYRCFRRLPPAVAVSWVMRTSSSRQRSTQSIPPAKGHRQLAGVVRQPMPGVATAKVKVAGRFWRQ